MKERKTVLKPEDLAGERLYFNDFLTALTIEMHTGDATTFMICMDNIGEKTYAVPHVNAITKFIILNLYDKTGHFIGCGLCDEIVIIDAVMEDEDAPDVE